MMQVKLLRVFRKIHRTTGAFLFVFFFVISISGLLLGWKKNSGGIILPQSAKGTSTDLNTWISIDSLQKKALGVLKDSLGPAYSDELDRIDVRPDKGIVKFVFTNHYQEIQLDGATGNLLQINTRRSDFIEDLHDGSFLDFYFKTDGEPFKLFYTSMTGLALFIFTITGFYLWYGPIALRNQKKRPV
ncbi:MAG: hypothetical protein RLZZ417_3014 [Bacteroidota bacterium]|jgi:uncharacterized iron-regulated membrane protein